MTWSLSRERIQIVYANNSDTDSDSESISSDEYEGQDINKEMARRRNAEKLKKRMVKKRQEEVEILQPIPDDSSMEDPPAVELNQAASLRYTTPDLRQLPSTSSGYLNQCCDIFTGVITV